MLRKGGTNESTMKSRRIFVSTRFATFLIIGSGCTRKAERKFFREAATYNTLFLTNKCKKKKRKGKNQNEKEDERVLFPLERLKTVYVRIDDRSERREEKKL